MATLNLSTNGPSINKSYQSIVNAPAPSGAAASSPTYGQWAVFSVSAPLVSAFQNDGGKESVMKVQATGEGELIDLVEEFSDGRIQFAFVKVKDPNTTLPKSVLIAWCGEGVPERTKGYFGSHLTAASKLLHGYHVQVTARSDADLSPEGIVQKVSDASGSKYSGAPASSTAAKPPPVSSKPVFMPTRVGGGGSGFQPLGRSRAAPQNQAVDNDGWEEDAPPVTRSQLEKVPSAYQPTKVSMSDYASQKQEPSRYAAPTAADSGASDVVKGAYQPVGKVDIAALRRQAKDTGSTQDDRPTVVKGSYEPVGKVDIAAIRSRAQGPGGATSPPSNLSPAATGASARSNEPEERPSLADRSSAFNTSERLTSLPKPKVSKSFGGSSFTGTKAPTPGGFSAKPAAPAAPPVGTASRTFADQGGKTPAQIWAEKKARERGTSGAADHPPAASIPSQTSGDGGWKSGYTGKSWAPVQTTRTGASAASSNLSQQNTGQEDTTTTTPPQDDEPTSPAGGVSAMRDRFKGAPPMGAASSRPEAPSAPPMDFSSKPTASGGARGVPIPGLPARPKPTEDDDGQVPDEQTMDVPPPPAVPRSPTPPSPDMTPSSPIRLAMPVGRSGGGGGGGDATEMSPPDERFSPPPLPTDAMARAAERAAPPPPEPAVQAEDPARSAGLAAAEEVAAATPTSAGGATGGRRAIAQYDYERAEENELELVDGEEITDIEMVDDDWWMGRNSRGEAGLFPSNYVELIEEGGGGGGVEAQAYEQEQQTEQQQQQQPGGGGGGHTATAEYDYEAAEDNELSFPEGATITAVEFPDDDWWYGEYGGRAGLFPANYVTLDS